MLFSFTSNSQGKKSTKVPPTGKLLKRSVTEDSDVLSLSKAAAKNKSRVEGAPGANLGWWGPQGVPGCPWGPLRVVGDPGDP